MVGKLHILTNTRVQQRWSHLELAEMAFAGGADVVQYRNKSYKSQHQNELQACISLPRSPAQKLIINDRVDLALALGADGAHVGQEDIEPVKSRALLGPDKLLGATVHNVAELEALEGVAVDYIGVGPVFGTRSKDTGLPPLGLKGLAEICRLAPFPVIAIGSISLERLPEVLAAGAHGVAVISAFCLAEDPVQAARKFRGMLDA